LAFKPKNKEFFIKWKIALALEVTLTNNVECRTIYFEFRHTRRVCCFLLWRTISWHTVR